ncbi:MAG: Gar1/Naf1 family protein [Sulfolobales archaeon]
MPHLGVIPTNVRIVLKWRKFILHRKQLSDGERLKRLGYFLHKTSSGRLIVKLSSPKPPRLGSKVLSSRGEVIGVLVDVIGPVRSPYAVVKPIKPEVSVDPYEELFVR